MPKYKVLVGIDYPPNRRAEIGDIVEDIPSKSIKWLREQGIIELADGKGMSGAYTDSGNSDSTYCVTYTPYKSGTRVLAGSNNWLMGPYFSAYNLYAGAFANGSAVTLDVAVISTAWKAASGNFALRVNGSAQGGNAGSTAPGTIGLGVRGAFTENAGSKIQEIIFANPSTTNDTTKVSQIEAKMSYVP